VVERSSLRAKRQQRHNRVVTETVSMRCRAEEDAGVEALTEALTSVDDDQCQGRR